MRSTFALVQAHPLTFGKSAAGPRDGAAKCERAPLRVCQTRRAQSIRCRAAVGATVHVHVSERRNKIQHTQATHRPLEQLWRSPGVSESCATPQRLHTATPAAPGLAAGTGNTMAAGTPNSGPIEQDARGARGDETAHAGAKRTKLNELESFMQQLRSHKQHLPSASKATKSPR